MSKRNSSEIIMDHIGGSTQLFCSGQCVILDLIGVMLNIVLKNESLKGDVRRLHGQRTQKFSEKTRSR